MVARRCGGIFIDTGEFICTESSQEHMHIDIELSPFEMILCVPMSPLRVLDNLR